MMVRNGHVELAGEGCFEAAEVVPEVLAERVAVEPLSPGCVSFVAWARAHVGMLQSSKQTVHWRSGAPIAVIAGAHSLLDQAAGG